MPKSELLGATRTRTECQLPPRPNHAKPASREDAKVLAGGHSLLPAMKLRLAQPSMLVDIGRIGGLAYIRESGKMRKVRSTR